MLSASGTDGDATVTLCHTKTKDLSEKTRVADIVIVAAGSHHLLKKDMVKQGAIVIDVGKRGRYIDRSFQGELPPGLPGNCEQ